MSGVSKGCVFLVVFAGAMAIVAGCAFSGEGAANAADTEEEFSFVGEVRWVPLEGGFYGLVAEDGREFLPIDLPEEFQKDGIKVKVRCKASEVYTIYMWGTPVEVLEIERR